MTERLSEAHRAMALAKLAEIEDVLSQMSAWLDQQGEEKPSILVEDCWRNLLAAQHLLSRDPAGRARLVHGRTSQDGYRGGLS